MAEATFENLMNGFGVVTVMDVKLYPLNNEASYTGRCTDDTGMEASSWSTSDNLCIDTLKIANLNMEGPTKTITGGRYANPLIKYGKTMTCEMQDALGNGAVLERFMGCSYDKAKRISITDKFPGAFAIEGKTFFIDQQTGEKVYVYIFIPQFLPDAIFNLTQDAEGDAAIFDLNGTLGLTKITDTDGTRDIFYEIRKDSFFPA